MFKDPCTFEDEHGKKGFPPPSGNVASLQHTLGVDGQTDYCATRGESIKIKMNTQCHTPRSAPWSPKNPYSNKQEHTYDVCTLIDCQLWKNPKVHYPISMGYMGI